ncbi:hypothetical protein AL062_02775 [Pseudomonas syringae pv. syringae]|uniref:hypothetical protein n=1 Tax=Pseudomonas syringae TaxID=317 RepID=UPI000760927F|nr:hypothetical protein [Pseudomonas syringae]KWS20858.1 hypothetical protein AL062_02775 [Pseudomonas syringae pv. syringae]
MEDFIDIDESRVISLQEYVASIEDNARRNAVIDMFDNSLPLLELMKANFRARTEIPAVSVRTTPAAIADTNPLGIIIVSVGMIDHCLNAQWPQSHEVLGHDGPYVLGMNLVAQLGMGWVLAHEYTHMFRHHHEVETHLGSTKQVKRAFEHDADLCATAGIYRRLQYLMGKFMPDDAVRRYAVFALFWIIRSIPETKSGAGIHPSFSERFFQITLKLVVLQETPGELYDPDLKSPRTRARGDRVMDAAISCERVYQDIFGMGAGNYFTDWLAYFSSGGHTRIIRDWIKVSPWVEHFSGLRADMKAPYIALQKEKRSAKKAKKVRRQTQKTARKNSRKH